MIDWKTSRRGLSAIALGAAIAGHTGRPWAEALLDLSGQSVEQAGAMSEYDLYGQFVTRQYPGGVAQTWYAGIKVTPEEFSGARPIPGWKRRFRFVSNHERG